MAYMISIRILITVILLAHSWVFLVIGKVLILSIHYMSLGVLYYFSTVQVILFNTYM